jgi:hypothetical protein
MINDYCDYCAREFGRDPGAPAICPNCGIENARQVLAAGREPERAPGETAMLAPAVEQAVRPALKPRKRRGR